MTITLAVPHIRLLRSPDLRLALRAWSTSRPNEVDVNIKDVLKIDAPVNEFPRVTFEAYVPILIREIICSLRDHVVWARTSRVDNLNDWPVYKCTALVEGLYAEMQELRQSGNDQDDFRMKLPLGYFTRFTCDLPLRTFIKLADYFYSRAASARIEEQHDIADLFQTMHYQLRGLLPAECEDVKFKPYELCPRCDETDQRSLKVGAMVLATCEVPIALRAQVVRHRMFMIADNLSDLFKDVALELPISTTIKMQVAAPVEVAEGIVKKRQCWISQTDLWQPLIEKLSAAFSVDTMKPPLPCDHNDPVCGRECPYQRDNQLRIEGKDPGIPCPVYAQLYKVPLTPDQRTAARTYANKRSAAPFWYQEVDKEQNLNG